MNVFIAVNMGCQAQNLVKIVNISSQHELIAKIYISDIAARPSGLPGLSMSVWTMLMMMSTSMNGWCW